MITNMNQVLRSFSLGLDAVESDFLGASTHHGPRIAVLCIAMGRRLGMSEAEITTLAACALLHDNALTEYILSERPGSAREFNQKTHCIIGQRNIAALPLPTDSEGLILLHHEQADGNGPFGMTQGEYPDGAALIAIADMLDVRKHLQRVAPQALPELRAFIERLAGKRYATRAAEALLDVLDEEMLLSLRDEVIEQTIAVAMPDWTVDLSHDAIVRLASFTARIIDYKSQFTEKHSVQIANIAWQMARYYGCDEETRAKLYLAGALHDIGKLYIPTAILEKAGALSDEEYAVIQTHVKHTRDMLSQIAGFEDVCAWASNHHEKLNGNGYARGLGAEELDHHARLLACIDVYQAISAERPYHPMRSHAQTIEIMRGMVAQGHLDGDIVNDLDREMAAYPNEAVPAPDMALV